MIARISNTRLKNTAAAAAAVAPRVPSAFGSFPIRQGQTGKQIHAAAKEKGGELPVDGRGHAGVPGQQAQAQRARKQAQRRARSSHVEGAQPNARFEMQSARDRRSAIPADVGDLDEAERGHLVEDRDWRSARPCLCGTPWIPRRRTFGLGHQHREDEGEQQEAEAVAPDHREPSERRLRRYCAFGGLLPSFRPGSNHGSSCSRCSMVSGASRYGMAAAKFVP